MKSNSKEPKNRCDLAEEMTWDLTRLYPSESDWENDFNLLDRRLDDLLKFQGHLKDSPETLLQALQADDELDCLEERLFVYAHLKADENTADSKNNGRLDRITGKAAEIEGKIAWLEPELMKIPKAKFHSFCQSEVLAFYRRTLEETERERKHTLSAKEERILGMSSEIFAAPHKIFSMLNDADLRFPTITDAKGQRVEITHGNYITLLESPERSVRQAAFNALYDTYASLKNTFGTILDGTVKASILDAELHHHPSALEAALHSDNIPVSVYQTLIDTVHDNLPSLHRYFQFRAKHMGMKKIDMFDIHNPLVKGFEMEVPFPKAVSMVREALRPLGRQYGQILEQAFTERWIDVEECRGKRSGAYSSGCYRKPPYILLNHSNTLDSAFTLAHELGHSLHSYFSDHAQKFHYASYRIFAAEVASTTNELLLHHSLMQNASDPALRAYLLNHLIDTIRGTVFRQTMFAEFERDIHAMAEQGLPLTPDSLCAQYLKLNTCYHGPAVIENQKIQFEWERIPHFHYQFYVYKYATGLSAAAALSRDILAGKTERYLNFLKAGDSKDVMDILKDAGVDFSTPGPIVATMKLFDDTLDDLIATLNPKSAKKTTASRR